MVMLWEIKLFYPYRINRLAHIISSSKEMIDETAEKDLKSALNEFAEAFSAENSTA